MPAIVVLSSDNDNVTQTMYGYARQFMELGLAADIAHLHNSDANQIDTSVSAEETRGIFVFLHGSKKPFGVVSHRGDLIFGRGSGRSFRRRIVCGTCHSLNGFGAMVAKNSGTVIGYDGELQLPTNAERSAQMASAVLAAHKALNGNRSAGEAMGTARMEYNLVADRWSSEGTVEGQVLAAVAIMNSSRIGVKGSRNATLRGAAAAEADDD
jgi:hypothetical protein